jgi:hypothetical protein
MNEKDKTVAARTFLKVRQKAEEGKAWTTEVTARYTK